VKYLVSVLLINAVISISIVASADNKWSEYYRSKNNDKYFVDTSTIIKGNSGEITAWVLWTFSDTDETIRIKMQADCEKTQLRYLQTITLDRFQREIRSKTTGGELVIAPGTANFETYQELCKLRRKNSSYFER